MQRRGRGKRKEDESEERKGKRRGKSGEESSAKKRSNSNLEFDISNAESIGFEPKFCLESSISSLLLFSDPLRAMLWL